MKRYLIIDEWQDVYQTDEPTIEDLDNSNKGYLTIIDVKEGKYFLNGEWEDIPDVNQEDLEAID